MSVTYLRSDVLRTVHAHLIQTYGGIEGIRDENALESAVARPKQLHHYTGEARIGLLAASLPWRSCAIILLRTATSAWRSRLL